MSGALELFDSLEAVAPSALRGAWTGREFPTGHRLDGALTAYGWCGKRFDSDEQVHPLLFAWGGRRLALRPRPLAGAVSLLLRWPWLKNASVARVLRLFLPLLATRRSRARLRSVRFRGRETAAMVYDDVPIVDYFRRVDEATVLGLMDMKGMSEPFFFLLVRQDG